MMPKPLSPLVRSEPMTEDGALRDARWLMLRCPTMPADEAREMVKGLRYARLLRETGRIGERGEGRHG